MSNQNHNGHVRYSEHESETDSDFGRQTELVKGATPHHTAALATELSRNSLSRERFEILLKISLVISILLLVSISVNFYLSIRPVEFRYFATDSEGGIREIEVLTRPVQSEQLVLNWTTQALTEAYSMSFANQQQQLKKIKRWFTAPGWRGYLLALERSGIVESLTENQVVTSAVPRGAPVVVAQGLVDGVYGWRVQLPLLVTFSSASVGRSQELLIDATVVRRPTVENPIGLGITRITSS